MDLNYELVCSFLLDVILPLEAWVLDSVILLETKVEPEENTANDGESPWEPDVERGWSVDKVASSLPILVAKDELGGEDSNGKPTESTFDWFVLSLWSIPCVHVDVTFSVSNGTKAKPQKETSNWEEMLWRNKQSVIEEKSREEMDKEQNLLINDQAKSLVTLEHFPIPETLLALTSKEIVFSNAKLANGPQTSCNSWNIAEQDVHDDMVPPTLTEVRQNMLHR